MIYLNFIILITLLTLSYIDWRSYRIPNSGILVLLLSALALTFLQNSWSKSLVSGFLILTLLSLLYGLGYLFKKQQVIGMGDLKLCTVLGFTLNLYNLALFIFLIGIFGLATGLYFRLRKHSVLAPMAPAISLSYLIIYYLFQ